MANIVGSGGNDNLFGTKDPDFIEGLAGNDTINPRTRQTGVGDDIVDGGDGIDSLVVDATKETQSVFVNFNPNNSPLFGISATSGKISIQARNFERISFVGGSGDDVINTGDRAAAVEGRGGIDHWFADLSATTADVILDFRKTINQNPAAGIALLQSIERATLTTGAGDDRITGGAFADVIRTGAGNDFVDLGARATGIGTPFDFADGGAGIDTLSVFAQNETLPVQLDFNPISGAFSVSSASGNFGLTAENMEEVRFVGGAGDDVIDTGTRGGRVQGSGGSDHWKADLSGFTRAVKIDLDLFPNGEAIKSGGFIDIVNIEGLTIKSGSGDDEVKARSFDPRVDVIETGGGNDLINAGKRPIASGASDFADGGEGLDTLVVEAEGERLPVRLDFNPFNGAFSVVSDSGNFALNASNMERVEIVGGRAGDVLNGGDGNDLFDGRVGDDRLNGGKGKDTLDGGTGADTLFGGLGADVLDDGGDSGHPIGNTYIYTSVNESSRNAPDRVLDFTAPGRDVFDLSAIDANGGKAGNGAFLFVEDNPFSGQSGELRSVRGRLEGDVNGDGRADFLVLLVNGAILGDDALIL